MTEQSNIGYDWLAVLNQIILFFCKHQGKKPLESVFGVVSANGFVCYVYQAAWVIYALFFHLLSVSNGTKLQVLPVTLFKSYS